ncbi:CDC45 family [Carpediemonas membranifera]|uniref:CDC45 family n=1 Tax=Carpediemonas membranifera TaxID=201153 RepID=A0A8J6E2Z1_9EUKA|nr:CDC45 family [Carpediemonas membranifera]|eukprot:KAG9394931.1 CDC45 family [Carpediemonas membranifera]
MVIVDIEEPVKIQIALQTALAHPNRNIIPTAFRKLYFFMFDGVDSLCAYGSVIKMLKQYFLNTHHQEFNGEHRYYPRTRTELANSLRTLTRDPTDIFVFLNCGGRMNLPALMEEYLAGTVDGAEEMDPVELFTHHPVCLVLDSAGPLLLNNIANDAVICLADKVTMTKLRALRRVLGGDDAGIDDEDEEEEGEEDEEELEDGDGVSKGSKGKRARAPPDRGEWAGRLAQETLDAFVASQRSRRQSPVPAALEAYNAEQRAATPASVLAYRLAEGLGILSGSSSVGPSVLWHAAIGSFAALLDGRLASIDEYRLIQANLQADNRWQPAVSAPADPVTGFSRVGNTTRRVRLSRDAVPDLTALHRAPLPDKRLAPAEAPVLFLWSRLVAWDAFRLSPAYAGVWARAIGSTDNIDTAVDREVGEFLGVELGFERSTSNTHKLTWLEANQDNGRVAKSAVDIALMNQNAQNKAKKRMLFMRCHQQHHWGPDDPRPVNITSYAGVLPAVASTLEAKHETRSLTAVEAAMFLWAAYLIDPGSVNNGLGGQVASELRRNLDVENIMLISKKIRNIPAVRGGRPDPDRLDVITRHWERSFTAGVTAVRGVSAQSGLWVAHVSVGVTNDMIPPHFAESHVALRRIALVALDAMLCRAKRNKADTAELEKPLALVVATGERARVYLAARAEQAVSARVPQLVFEAAQALEAAVTGLNRDFLDRALVEIPAMTVDAYVKTLASEVTGYLETMGKRK